MPDIPERYSRQVRFAGIGEDGQRRLMQSRVTLVGCGALGTVLANALVRAGVGYLRLIDRDFIETNNLQRQILFDEDDIAFWSGRLTEEYWQLRGTAADAAVLQELWSFFLRASIHVARLRESVEVL